MCDECFVPAGVKPNQYVAIVRTTDGLVHYRPLDAIFHPTNNQGINNAITLTRNIRRGGLTFCSGDETVVYDAADILGPIVFKQAKDVVHAEPVKLSTSTDRIALPLPHMDESPRRLGQTKYLPSVQSIEEEEEDADAA